MDNTLHGRQSYTSAFELFRPVQTLEYTKEFIDILHLKTNAIVSNEHDYLIFFSSGVPYLNLSLLAYAGEFNSIGNNINEHKLYHGTVSIDIGQGANVPNNIA